MEINQIFNQLGKKLKESVHLKAWDKAVLEVMRVEKTVEFKAHVVSGSTREELEIRFGYYDAQAVHELYEITMKHPLEHTQWNRLVFTLTSGNSFEVEYKWDQELQDRIDRYNKE